MNQKHVSPSFWVKCSIILCTAVSSITATAKEGMWVPATIKQHEQDMKSMGLQIPVDQLYNKNGTGLNNAIVLFGKGCTGEIISSRGLILTNHHCGYSSAQGLSTPDKDYFAYGFWAKNLAEELPCKGLTVTFIRRMENVTPQVTKGINDTLRDQVRDSLINLRIAQVEKEFKTKTGLDASIKQYFKGNQYWVALSETYRDIRLTGFPPNGIGAFGGDVENWMWPRHTGDFSVFRIYAGADNKPADYAPGNKPYNADQYLKINISGYKEGDFTMVYGFPGTTNEYISSYALKHVFSISDPISIDVRTKRLDVWTKHMTDSRDIFLKYTSKRAGVANGWKKWQGEVMGLKANNVMGIKQAGEQQFQAWADRNHTLPYAANLLPEMRSYAEAADKAVYTERYINEAVLGIELIQQGSVGESMLKCFRLKLTRAALRDTLTKLANATDGFYKNYDAATDKDVFTSLMKAYIDNCGDALPEYYKKRYAKYDRNIKKWADYIYGNTMFASKDELVAFAGAANTEDSADIAYDPAYRLYDAITKMRKKELLPALSKYTTNMRYLERLYMKAQMMQNKKKDFYPDANLTLRLTYGQIKGLDPDGAAPYSYQTTLGDVVALDDASSESFKVPQKLKDLYGAKDYGRWGVKGVMPVAFTASNHTSGGNSGSPVLNARGELIGTNFDRAYEGTMSDYYFDPTRCRNISVDIRYTLFIIDKFGGAGWLMDELKLVK